jgi:hypothetical protein
MIFGARAPGSPSSEAAQIMSTHFPKPGPLRVLAPAVMALTAATLWTLSTPGALDAVQDGSTAGGRAIPAADAEVTMILPGGDAMKYWSRWRGPSGQGLVEGTAYPDAWSDTQGISWKVRVPGRGHSSPIVWGDRIFLTSAAEDGSSRSVLCFRRSDGKLLWQTAVPTAAAEKLYPKNSYASSTVSTDGQRVYAYFGNAGLLALDFNGKQVWHVSFGSITLYHGPGGSPLLQGPADPVSGTAADGSKHPNRPWLHRGDRQDDRQATLAQDADAATGVGHADRDPGR